MVITAEINVIAQKVQATRLESQELEKRRNVNRCILPAAFVLFEFLSETKIALIF